MEKPRLNNWKTEELENLSKDYSDYYDTPLTYKELTNLLGIGYKTGGAKINQLDDLSKIFDIYISRKPTRYYIVGRTDYDIENIALTKTELLFRDTLFYLFYNSGSQELRYTNSTLLEKLGLVNRNFVILTSSVYKDSLPDDLLVLRNFAFSLKTYLFGFAFRAISKLERRGYTKIEKAYNLLKSEDGKDCKAYSIFVEKESMDEFIIKAIVEETKSKLNLKGEWMSDSIYPIYVSLTSLYTKKLFGPQYIRFYKTNSITTDLDVEEVGFADCRQEINEIVVEKIRKTKMLDNLSTATGKTRDELIDEIIVLNPAVDYLDGLKDNKAKDMIAQAEERKKKKKLFVEDYSENMCEITMTRSEMDKWKENENIYEKLLSYWDM